MTTTYAICLVCQVPFDWEPATARACPHCLWLREVGSENEGMARLAPIARRAIPTQPYVSQPELAPPLYHTPAWSAPATLTD